MAKNLSRKTINTLRKIENLIQEDPRKLDMTQWGTVYDKSSPDYKRGNVQGQGFNSCGTVACIAGWTCLLNVPKLEKNLRIAAKKQSNPDANYDMDKVGEVDLEYELSDVQEEATALLGLTDEQASRLFFVNHWPKRFKKAYEKAVTPVGRKSATTKRLEFFISTDATDGNEAWLGDGEYNYETEDMDAVYGTVNESPEVVVA